MHLTLPSASILIAILGTKGFTEAPKPIFLAFRLLLRLPELMATQGNLGHNILTLNFRDTKLLGHTGKELFLTILKHVNMQFHSVGISLE